MVMLTISDALEVTFKTCNTQHHDARAVKITKTYNLSPALIFITAYDTIQKALQQRQAVSHIPGKGVRPCELRYISGLSRSRSS